MSTVVRRVVEHTQLVTIVVQLAGVGRLAQVRQPVFELGASVRKSGVPGVGHVDERAHEAIGRHEEQNAEKRLEISFASWALGV